MSYKIVTTEEFASLLKSSTLKEKYFFNGDVKMEHIDEPNVDWCVAETAFSRLDHIDVVTAKIVKDVVFYTTLVSLPDSLTDAEWIEEATNHILNFIGQDDSFYDKTSVLLKIV